MDAGEPHRAGRRLADPGRVQHADSCGAERGVQRVSGCARRLSTVRPFTFARATTRADSGGDSILYQEGFSPGTCAGCRSTTRRR